MSSTPFQSFREGDVYDQISRFEQRRPVSPFVRGHDEEEGSDGMSPSPPPPSHDLPSRLYECHSVVRVVEVSGQSPGGCVTLVFQEDEGCGILELQGGDMHVFSFFLASHCAEGRLPRQGQAVLTNSRLVDAGNKVPFLSAAVWVEGEVLEQHLLDAIMTDKAPLDELAKHAKLAEYLAFTLEAEIEGDKKRPGDGEGGERRRKKVKFDDGYRSSQDKEGNGEVHQEEPELEKLVEEEEEPEEEELKEEFSEEGVEAKVDRFMNNRIGVLTITHPDTQKPMKVLFNIAQVWDGVSPFLETRPSWGLKHFMEEAKLIRVNARNIENSFDGLALQATAVWTSDCPPSNYLNTRLVTTLSLQLRRHLSCLTGKIEFRTNPLAGQTDTAVSGRVVEYFSRDMGFVKLDIEDGNVVMFHLNQVWQREAGATVPLQTVQGLALQSHLPLGSQVMVAYRRLPAQEVSALRYQASVLWRLDGGEEQEVEVPLEYVNQYASHEARVGLLEELDHYHDCMKELLGLNLPPTDPRFRPVQTILNGLPFEWQAQIVAGINLEFGIIQISNVDGMEFNIGPGVKFLYAMFHIEDVWDASGVKIPTIAMPMLINSCVDLTARPICSQAEPERVFDLQRKLMEEKLAYGEIPLLQAVVVCVKKFAYDEVDVSRIAQPTVLREGPGSFGLDITEFYLNHAVGHRLDLKLQRYLNIPNNLQFLYERVMRKIDLRDDKMIKMDLRKIDSWHRVGSHGALPPTAQRLPMYMTIHRNVGAIQSIRNQLVRPVLLHSPNFKTDCGVVELVINNSGKPLKTYAFFELSQFISFKPVNYLVTDLTNMIQMPAKETFHAHMEMAFPDCPVPYVVLALWNEDSRKMFGAPVPQPVLNQNQPFVDARKYFEACKDTVVDIVRVASMVRPPPEKDMMRKGGKKGGKKGAKFPPMGAPPPAKPGVIEWKDIVNDFYGVVLRIVNNNYGLAAGILTNGRDDAACMPFQLLFDSCDIYIEDRACDELGKELAEVVEVGDFIRFNAVRVEMERKQPSRNLRYLASGVVTAKTAELIKTAKLPDTAPKISFMSQLSQSKIDNFKAIAAVLNTVKLDDREEEIFQKLESGELAEVKNLKKSFATETKVNEKEDEDVLIKKFQEMHPITGEEEHQHIDKMDHVDKPPKTKKKDKVWEAEPVDEEMLSAEKALKEKAMERVKIKKQEENARRERALEMRKKNKEAKEAMRKASEETEPVKEPTPKPSDQAEKPAIDQSQQEKPKQTPEPVKKRDQPQSKQAPPKQKEGESDMEKICEELTPKQIRKLVMAYMEIVSNLPEKNPRNKIDPQTIAQKANLEKDSAFLEKFFLAFGHGCRNAFKGMKVGSVFVTQTQVKGVMAKGIMGPEHILREGEEAAPEEQTGDIFSDYSPDQLRRLLLAFLKLMDRGTTWSDIAKEHSVPVESAMKLLLAITEKCKEVAKNDVREVTSFKLQAIFVSKDWAKKIFNYGFTGQEEEEEIEEITLDSD